MKGSTSLIFAAAMAGTVIAAAHAQSPHLPGWRLVWSEEFTGASLDTTRWNSENIAWPYNAELQYYLPQQATVASSTLNIKAERRNHGGRAYVSARINTSGKFAQQYGRFEARMKVPAGQGFWPAFWLLPQSQAWPPEIDIMEHIGGVPNRIYMTHHWGTVNNVMSNGAQYHGPDFTLGYHNYAVEWGPYRVDWFIDGVQRFSTTANFPREPMYIILNMAVGGTLPGNPDANTPFPASTLVDWVRVYQRDIPLANPGFEAGVSGGAAANWQNFGNAIVSPDAARSDALGLRLFGSGGAGPYYAGVFQDFPASPGQVWRGTVYLRNSGADPLTGGNFVDVKIEWYDHNGAALGVQITPALTDASPINTFSQVTVQATAPAMAAKARFAIVYVKPGSGSGTVHVDDATFTFISPVAVNPCPADYNGVGGLSVQDIFDYIASYFANDPRADFNTIGGISVQDLFDFLAFYFDGC
jgi:beta-glucanase (GH16 family)